MFNDSRWCNGFILSNMLWMFLWWTLHNNASFTGFDKDGPDATRPAFDTLLQAAGGLISVTGNPEPGKQVRVGVSIVDICSGLVRHIYIFHPITECYFPCCHLCNCVSFLVVITFTIHQITVFKIAQFVKIFSFESFVVVHFVWSNGSHYRP